MVVTCAKPGTGQIWEEEAVLAKSWGMAIICQLIISGVVPSNGGCQVYIGRRSKVLAKYVGCVVGRRSQVLAKFVGCVGRGQAQAKYVGCVVGRRSQVLAQFIVVVVERKSQALAKIVGCEWLYIILYCFFGNVHSFVLAIKTVSRGCDNQFKKNCLLVLFKSVYKN